MAERKVAPFGSWQSPISSDLIVSSTIRLGQVQVDGDHIYWIEGRPTEGGRSVIVHRTPDGRVSDVTPPPFNARTRVHEYGGGDFAVADDVVFFSNFADQRLYRQDPASEPRPITPEADMRYADMIVDSRRQRLICVREDHTDRGREPVNTLAQVDLAGERPAGILVSGNDFYSSPSLSPDGARLAWLTWNHPNMPWDGTELWVGEIDGNGSVAAAALVAGGLEESIFQPTWSPDGALYFISDRNGWWNLYRWSDGQVEPVIEMEAEFGQPQWIFGMSTYAFASADRVICSFSKNGISQLASVDTKTRRLTPLQTPYSEIGRCCYTTSRRAVFLGGSPTHPSSVAQIDLSSGQVDVLRASSAARVDQAYVSIPTPLEFPTANGLTAHAFYYPPQNGDFTAPPGELPPLIVKSHGGPTSAASITFNLSNQYWTSRGFAVLDVNYGGSTGYGRAYRQRLNGQWGIVDVDDCVNGARYLADRGMIDRNRMAITGGSAGGYTTLCALTFRDVFKAGASHYGVGDLEALARDTHKFEARYLDRLIGPYPERRDLYVERSPIHYADRLSCPVILLQGLDDEVVPPNQAELMVEAMRAKGLPFAYVTFAGEGHGFRRAETIKRALEAELYFYSRIFGFALAEPVEPVTIENL